MHSTELVGFIPLLDYAIMKYAFLRIPPPCWVMQPNKSISSSVQGLLLNNLKSRHDITKKMSMRPVKTDQPGYLPSLSLRCLHQESMGP